MTQERLQEIIDLAHSDRKNPMSDALIHMIDAYIQTSRKLAKCEEMEKKAAAFQGY